MSDEEVLEKISFALFYSDYIWENNVPIDKMEEYIPNALERWNIYKKSLNKPPWSNGRHSGDCTDEPIACKRCIVEEFRSPARMIMYMNFNDFVKENI